MLIFIISALLNFAFAQESSPVIDPDKFTICTMTINSDDEKQIFQSQVAKHPKKFNPIVELTTMGEDNWFENACKSGIRCDQLVISGHFAGEFFGDNSSKKLPLKEIEKAGCSKTCEGILSQPLEVFLFGCNTLAEKETDHRTPAQYLQVLLQDGIPLSQAEQIVQSRYGAVGDSNKSSMQRAFGGENKRLYGFHSVGPSGKNVKGFLQNYFKNISAPEHLEKLQAKRMTAQVLNTNKALSESLKVTAYTECDANSLQDEKTKAICKLQDTRVSIDEKLDTIVELMTRKDSLIYFPYINEFFKQNKIENLTSNQRETLKQLTQNSVIKEQIIGLAEKTPGLGFKKVLLDFAHNLNYIDDSFRNDMMKSEIRKILAKPLTEAAMMSLCSSDEDLSQYVQIQDSDLQNKTVGANEIYAYSCLNVKDPIIVNRVLNSKVKKDEDMKNVMLDLISNVDPKTIKLPAYLSDHIQSLLKLPEERAYALDLHTKFLSATPETLALSRSILLESIGTNDNSDWWLLQTAAEHIIASNNNAPATLNAMITAMNGNLKNCTQCIDYLIKSDSPEDKVQQTIVEQLNQSTLLNSDMQKKVLEYYRTKLPKTINSQMALVEYANTGMNSDLKKEAIEILKLQKDSLHPEVKAKLEILEFKKIEY